MNIQLEHDFFKMGKCYDLQRLLQNNTLSKFCKELNRQAESSQKIHEKNYKGWGFEMLIEALIKLSPIDNRIGIMDYHPIEDKCDWGVDGYGIGMNGKPCAVQMKYKSDSTKFVMFNDDHIANFIAYSQKFKVDSDDTKNLIIFTTGSGLHHSMPENEICQNSEGKFRLVCRNYNDLRGMLDNNFSFWNLFRRAVGY